jgi:outer membrane protein assembly factor BamB
MRTDNRIRRLRSGRARMCADIVASAALIALASCGRHSSKPGKKDTSPATAATQWSVILPVSDELPAVAQIASDKERALVTADGRVLDRKPLGDPNLLRNTLRSGETLVMISKSTILAVDVATGAERWTQKLAEVPTLYSIGDKEVAIAAESGVDLFDLSTSERRYHGAARPDRIYAEGSEFVFARGHELWLVDGDGRERWRADVTSNSDLRFEKAAILVLGNDGFTELDRATGRVLGHGDRPASGAVEAEAKTLGRDYQVVRSANKLALVARDAAGRQLWTAPWPREDVGTIERTLDDPDRNRVELVEASTRRTLLIIDGGTGKVVASRPLGSGDQLTALSGACAVVLMRSTNRVLCIDAATGQESWNIPISGEDTALWPLKGDDLLLADSNPLTLSRLDQSGKRRWQVELPNAGLSNTHTEKPTIIDTSGERREWVLSAEMAISVVPSGIRVLDLGTGKLHEVTL